MIYENLMKIEIRIEGYCVNLKVKIFALGGSIYFPFPPFQKSQARHLVCVRCCLENTLLARTLLNRTSSLSIAVIQNYTLPIPMYLGPLRSFKTT